MTRSERGSPRFPFAALYLRARRDEGAWALDDDSWNNNHLLAFTLNNLARMLGITHQHALKAASRGDLGYVIADEWACRLGYHPVDIWPDWYERMDAWQEEVEARRLARYERKLAANAERKRRRQEELVCR